MSTKPTTTKNKLGKEPVQISSTAELARILKVSQWTVSRAINGHPDIGEKTRKRVLQAMEEYGFQPNPLARGLRGRGSKIIGVSFTKLNTQMLDQKIFYLQSILRKQGYRCLLETTSDDPNVERNVLRDFKRFHVDGVISVLSQLSGNDIREISGNTPHVRVDPQTDDQVSAVYLDRREAMRTLFKHLWGFGHRRFATVGFDCRDNWRWPPLAEIVCEHGCRPEDIFQHFNMESSSVGHVKMGTLLAEKVLAADPFPTALIGLNDLVSLGVAHRLQGAGFFAPADYSITGFDHLELLHALSTPLTTIDQNPERMMLEAVTMLLGMIQSEPEKGSERVTPSICVAPTFISAESVGAAPLEISNK